MFKYIKNYLYQYKIVEEELLKFLLSQMLKLLRRIDYFYYR